VSWQHSAAVMPLAPFFRVVTPFGPPGRGEQTDPGFDSPTTHLAPLRRLVRAVLLGGNTGSGNPADSFWSASSGGSALLSPSGIVVTGRPGVLISLPPMGPPKGVGPPSPSFFFFLRGGLLCPLALLLIDLAVTLLGLLAGLVPAGVQCGLGVPASTEPRLEAPLPAGPSAYSSPLFSTALAFIRHLPAGLGGFSLYGRGPYYQTARGESPAPAPVTDCLALVLRAWDAFRTDPALLQASAAFVSLLQAVPGLALLFLQHLP
jgi:hypothetical protein